MPDVPLSYSLQSRSRESVSYMDALAQTGLNALRQTFLFLFFINVVLNLNIFLVLRVRRRLEACSSE